MDDETAIPPPVHPWVAAGRRAIRFGVGMLGRPDWPVFLDQVRLAEALGFDAFWAQDHPTTAFDCWTTLTALATQTATIRLGSFSCVSYRSPVLLARVAADVDRLSRGRLILGVGIGDDPAEFEQIGLPWPSTAQRQQALEEAVTIVRGLWAGGPFTFEGRHFGVRDARLPYGPVQRPGVPLLIAGGGERVTLRQVARYADMANFGPHPWTGGAATPDDVRRKLAALRQHCQELGRPYEAIVRSHTTFPVVLAESDRDLRAKLRTIPGARLAAYRAARSLVAGMPEEAVAYYQALVDAGIRYFVISIYGEDVETLHLIGERVRPRLVAKERTGD